MLDFSGTLAATLLGGIVFGLGGWPWALLLLAFFVSSSLLSRAFATGKKSVESDFAKGGRRDWAQVAANGGFGVLMLLAAAIGWLDIELAWVGYAATLAAVSADTWATELGVLSADQPRLITNGKQVPRGSSGAISLLGTAASLAGGSLIAILTVPYSGPGIMAVVVTAGLVGSLTDSLLGATVQTMYFCPNCQKESERHPQHSCGTATQALRGWSWLGNDWVNFISAGVAAGLAIGLALAL
jgi:uncharacterized protein (TIGR00297 family)